MKNNLGRIFLIILIILNAEIFASTYKWSGYANKTSAHVNEAVYLKYVCEFSDKSELYSIDFNPVTDNEKYSLKFLSQDENIVNNKRVNIYEFIALAKVAGTLSFDLSIIMKKTTKDSIENTVLGRDNVENEEFSAKVIRLKSLKLEVLDSDSEVVGDFSMKIKQDQNQLKAFEPYHMEIIISGTGNFKSIKPYAFNIDGVKVFSSEPVNNIELTKNGFTGEWSQKFAFVSDKDFNIPEINFKYFELKSDKLKEISFKYTNVEVTNGYLKEELLDDEVEKNWLKIEYIYYLLTFMAGFLLAKVKFTSVKVLDEKKELFKQKIMKVKSLEELMIILVLEGSSKYNNIITKIEHDSAISLESIKKETIKI